MMGYRYIGAFDTLPDSARYGDICTIFVYDKEGEFKEYKFYVYTDDNVWELVEKKEIDTNLEDE